MKIYLSYSSLGYQKKPSEFLVNLHKVCFYNLKKYFKEIYLITDSVSKRYFREIPWTNISLELDKVPKEYPEVWSLSKIMAYKEIAQRGDPFIHVDSDVILKQELPKRILESEIFVQGPETELKSMYNLRLFHEACPNLNVFQDVYPKKIYNLGILGAKNLNFIMKYVEKSLELVYEPDNQYFWKKFSNYNNSFWKAILAEQYVFAWAAEYFKQSVTNFFDVSPIELMDLDKKYAHLLVSKNSKSVQDRINLIARSIDFNKV